MKIRYMSDLHMEFTDYVPERVPSVGEDIVVLAGDIGIGTVGIEWAKRAFPDRPVLYVLGNHEFYRHDFHQLIDQAHASAKGSNVYFLENDRVDLGGIRFLGATLWTGFDLVSTSSRSKTIRACEGALNDFTIIRKGKQDLDVVDTIKRHSASRAWLEDEIGQSALPVVVVTHHSPSLANQHPDYIGEILCAAFHSNADDLFRVPLQLWISGHNHYSCEVQVNGIDLVSNQRGYPREGVRFSWDRCITIDVDRP
jgi:hypothetical protein